MKRLMKFYLLVLVFLSYLHSTDFTYTYPGVRANSMGSAFSSIADDPYAIFYNPAGLTQMKDWQISSSFNRKFSDRNLGEFSIGYTRPVPETKNKVFGFGFDAVRQSDKGRMDSYIFGISDETTLKYFQLPILYGANFRIMSIRYPYLNKSKLGIGFDAGVILSSVENYRTSIVLSKLMTGMGTSVFTVTVGNSYRYFDTTFALDLRITGSYSEFFYGFEHKMFNDLVRFRAGKGINLDGRGFLITGIGINFEPLIADISYSIPVEGLHKNSGAYGFNITYKFTGPSYKEKMNDAATQKVIELNSRIETLKEEYNTLNEEIARAQNTKGILESEVTLLKTQMEELQEKLRQANLELLDIEFQKRKKESNQKIVNEIKSIKKEKWPKLHKVMPGETLRSISTKYYGTPSMWQLIYDENQDKIFKGMPKEGEILTIPAPKK